MFLFYILDSLMLVFILTRLWRPSKDKMLRPNSRRPSRGGISPTEI